MENRVLVVDDEKEIRASLNKALRRLRGFHVALAGTGEGGLQKLGKYIIRNGFKNLKKKEVQRI
jgi:DNA-binding NtrC family response regulator